MKLIEINSYYSGAVLFTLETENMELCVEAAVQACVSLRGADLRGADLRDADLRDADLSGAVLRGAVLRGAVNDIPIATDEQSIKNLDTVRELILDDAKRLEMGHWHANDDWLNRTCAEEALCGTTHCLAGWLQTCSTDPKVRALFPATAGVILAPVAARMFYSDNTTVLAWLQNRGYVAQIAEDNVRHEARMAKIKAQT